MEFIILTAKKVENEKNFKNYIQKIEPVLKIWRMRSLTLEGKITIFKTLAISKIIHIPSVIVLPNPTITELNKIKILFRILRDQK